MNEKELKEFKEILKKQKERVSSSKKEAAKLLNKLGIMHLLVPKGTNQSVKSR